VLEAFLKKERETFNSLASRPLPDEDWYSGAFITAEKGKETEASQLFRELWLEGPLEGFEITDLSVSFLPYVPHTVGMVTAEVKYQYHTILIKMNIARQVISENIYGEWKLLVGDLGDERYLVVIDEVTSEASPTPIPQGTEEPTAIPDLLSSVEIKLDNAAQLVVLDHWYVSESPLTSLTFSPDHALLAVGDEQGGIYVYTFPEGDLLQFIQEIIPKSSEETPIAFRAYAPATIQLVFSEDGRQLYSLHNRASIRKWDVSSGNQLSQWDWEEFTPTSQVLSMDARFVAAFEDFPFGVGAWELASEEYLGDILLDRYTPGMLFSPDSEYLALWTPPQSVYSPISAEDYLGLYRLDGTLVAEAALPDGYGCENVLFSPDGELLVVRWAGTLLFYEFHDQSLTFRGEVNPPPPPEPTATAGGGLSENPTPGERTPTAGYKYQGKGMAYHPKEEIVASLDDDGKILLWDVKTLAKIVTVQAESDVRDLVFSPDGMILVGSTNEGDLVFFGVPE
jgi:WD40 repeat protein